MQHSAFSYLMLPFTFFFFLMNSSLHQWAAEISTKRSKTLCTAVEGSVYVYCVFACLFVCVRVCVCAHIYSLSIRICVKDYTCFHCCRRTEPLCAVWSTAVSPQKPNSFGSAQRLQTCVCWYVLVCVCVST